MGKLPEFQSMAIKIGFTPYHVEALPIGGKMGLFIPDRDIFPTAGNFYCFLQSKMMKAGCLLNLP